MSAALYDRFAMTLLGTALLSFLAAIAYLAALVGWRTPVLNRRYLWCAGLLAVSLGSIAAQQAMLRWVILPSSGRESRADQENAIAFSSLTQVGDIAPEFSIVTDNGSSFESSSQRGKVVVLNFFATWCGPCIQELPHLQALWNEFGTNKEFSMIVVGRGETSEAVARFKSKRRLTLPMAADPDDAVFNRYASQYIPRSYVISRNG